MPAYPPRANRSFQRLKGVVQDSQAQFALTTTSLKTKIHQRIDELQTPELQILATDHLSLDHADHWQRPPVTANDVAFLQYTSGSTGMPKGVMVSHGNLLHNCDLIQMGFQHPRDRVAVSWLPPYHDMGLIGNILAPVKIGCSMVSMPPVAFLQRPSRWLAAIAKYQAVTSGAPNFAYDLCCQQISDDQIAQWDLSSWTLAFSGAEPVRISTIEKFSDRFGPAGFKKQAFYPCYGMAETTLMVSGGKKHTNPTTQTLPKAALESHDIFQPLPPGEGGTGVTLVSSGRAMADLTVKIVHPHSLEPCVDHQIGEVWVRGNSVAQGYWRKPEVNQGIFQATTAEDPHPYLRTGDLGFLSDGELYITGRLKDLLIIRGRNHYPQDIELTVENCHEAIATGVGAAVSINVGDEEELVIIQEVKRTYVRKLKDQSVVEAITQAIKQAIAETHELLPQAIVLIKTGSIPRTSSGKVRRHACKQAFLDGQLKVLGQWSQQAPLTENLAQVVQGQGKSAPPRPLIAGGAPKTTTAQTEKIMVWLGDNIGRRLGISPQTIDPDQTFASYGLDSLQAVQLTAELEDWLGQKLEPTLAYDYPSIRTLAHHLAQDTATPGRSPELAGLVTPSPKPPEDLEIAVVAMGCRFPQAENLGAFWQLLSQGKDAITQNQDRWSEPMWGGFLDGVEDFDPQFFGIAPREAELLDPQQRLLLEVTWEALEQGAIAPQSLRGQNVGVFMGISGHDYSQLQIRHQTPINAYMGTGNAHSMAANRLSYFFDWRGPSLAIDTACSSSLVATHLACESLRRGESSLAVVGGVNLILSPDLTQTFQQAGMMSPRGRCHTFDSSADGYVRGEGCGVVVLKPLRDAQRDRNQILGIIHGSAMNQDGRSNGLTAPNGLAQQAVIRQALAQGGIDPQTLSYVEAHGTGTVLGDPIEVHSLKQVLAPAHLEGDPLYLGSVKTNIGHLEAAAGIAGLIKVLLALGHGEIPPHRNFHTLNPHIDLGDRLKIATENLPWPHQDRPRLAGVSSFGFGGTNAHVIVGDPRQPLPPIAPPRDPLPRHLFALSGKTPEALTALVGQYRQYLDDHPQVALEDLCRTLLTGRERFKYRWAIAVANRDELREKLAQFTPAAITGQTQGGKLAFLFTGQGSQRSQMARELYHTHPRFREILDHCDRLLAPTLEHSLRSVIFAEDPALEPLIHQTAYTQPALFAVEYALAQLWLSWGVEPDIVMGHSVGEYVAACVAGVFSLEDGLKLIAARGRLMQTLPNNGEMVAIFAPKQEILPLIQDCYLAADNASHCVISGQKQAIASIREKCAGQAIKTKTLQVSHAFHSPLMAPMVAEFEGITSGITYHAPQLPIISNVTGEVVAEDIACSQYWLNHILKPVEFAHGVQRLPQEGVTRFLEIGPKPTLLAMAQTALGERKEHYLWLPSLRPHHSDWQQLLSSLGQLYGDGFPVDGEKLYQGYGGENIPLPTYPFQRQRYWFQETFSALAPTAPEDSRFQNCFYGVQWEAASPPASPSLANHHWLILADRQGLAVELAEVLAQKGDRCELLFYEPPQGPVSFPHWVVSLGGPSEAMEFPVDLPWSDFTGIIQGWSLDQTSFAHLSPPAWEQNQKLGLGSVFWLCRTLETQRSPAKLWCLTRQDAPGSDVGAPELWGLGRAIANENPRSWGGIVDLSHHPNSQEIRQLAQWLHQKRPESQGRLRGDRREVPRLTPLAGPKVTPRSTPLTIAPKGWYLITGGLGALGLQVAQWLGAQGATQIMVLSRRPPQEQHQAVLERLRTAGIEVQVVQGDLGDRHSLETALAPLETDVLRGVCHCAGLLADGLVAQQSAADFFRVFPPKTRGTWHLYTHLERLGKKADLEFWVNFSSVSALLGTVGQGNYGGANAWLDRFSDFGRREGWPMVSINWGPWNQGGMATDTHLATTALPPLEPAFALEGLARILAMEAIAQVGFFQVDWPRLAQEFPDLSQNPYFSQVMPPPDSLEAAAAPSPWVQTLQEAPAEERETLILDYLREAIAGILGLQAQQIQPEDSLLDLGMDSLMVMEAISQLKDDLQIMLYPREFYDRPRLDSLAAYLAQEFAKLSQDPAETPPLKPTEEAAPPSPLHTTAFDLRDYYPREKIPTPMAFILSSPRSGSTLLRVMLAGHPQLCSPPELHLLPFGTMAQRAEELALSHLGEGLERALMELNGWDASQAQDQVQQWVTENRSVGEVYQQLQTWAGDRLLIDKSPSYGSDPRTLHHGEALFARAKYIHLVRHPYGVIESFCRLRMDKLLGAGGGNPYSLAEKIWRESNANIDQFCQGLPPENRLLVVYEDLVTQPEAQMKRICDFLGVAYDPAVLQPYQGDRMTDGLHQQSLGVGDPNFAKRRAIDPQLAHRWKTITLPQRLTSASQQLAKKFAYPLPQEDQPLAVEMKETFINVRGLKLCLCSWGDVNAPLIFCLHGILEQGASWSEVALRLVEKGYRVVAPDLRGHGRSEHVGKGGSYHLLDFLGDIDAIVDSLTDKAFTLVGHSLGSIIAGIFTSIRPQRIRNLVLVEAILPAAVTEEDAIARLSTQLDSLTQTVPEHPTFPDVATAAKRLQEGTPGLSDHLALMLAKRITEPWEGGVRWRWAPLLRTRTGLDFNNLGKQKYLQLLSRLAVPLTLIYGDRSNFNRPEDLAAQSQAMAQAQKHTVGGGHNLHFDAPEAIADIIGNCSS